MGNVWEPMSDSGWSYIEVIVCTVLVGIMAAAAIPVAGGLQRYQLNQEVACLLGDLHELKLMGRNSDYWSGVSGRKVAGPPRLVMNSSAGSYSITQNGKQLVSHIFGPGIRIQCSRPTMIFNMDGSAQPNTYTVSSGSYTRKIVIDVAGRIRIE